MILRTLMIGVLLGGLGPARVAAAPGRPTPAVRTLGNGLKVAVFSTPRLPVVQIALVIPAGAAAESLDEKGVANLTAEMIRQGTTSRDPAAFATELDRLGGDIDASGTRDYTTIAGSFLAPDFEAGMELLSDAIMHPALAERDLGRVKSRILLTLGQLHQSPARVAEEHLWKLAFSDHPYGWPLLGTRESVSRLTVDQIKSFYRLRYVPDGATLAIAGDVTPERGFAVASLRFGAWSGKAVPLVPVRPPVRRGRTIRIVDRPGATETALALGFIAPSRGSPDEVALSLANLALGASARSRLALLEEPGGLAGGARSDFVAFKDGGLLMIGVTARNDSVGSVVRRLRSELRRFVGDPPSERELKPIRRLAAQSSRMGLETLGGLLAEWTRADFYGLPAGDGSRVPDSVSAALVAAATRRWLDPARLIVVAVGPAAAIRRQLEASGAVEVVPEVVGSQGRSIASRTPSRAQQIKGRELVRLAVAAHGGLARLRGIKDSIMEADATLWLASRSMVGKIRQVRKDPFKMIYTTEFEGLATQQILNGERAWSLIDASGNPNVKEMDHLGVNAMRSGFGTDLPHLLRVAADPESRVASRARTELEGGAVDPVDVVSRQGERWVLYLDAASHRLVAIDLVERGAAGEGDLARRLYRDFRPVAGILWPHDEERRLNDQPLMRIRVTRVTLNSGLSETLFEAPGPELPPPAR